LFIFLNWTAAVALDRSVGATRSFSRSSPA